MMKRLAKSNAARFSMAGAIASAMLFAFPVCAQDSRLSLADRVSRLEQQAQNRDQSGIGLVNQLQQLQAQMQQLQGQIEQLQHQLSEQQDKGKAQYADLDARLGRLEGSGGAAGSANAAANPAVPAAAAVTAATATAAATASNNAPAAASSAVANANPADVQAAYDSAFKAIRAGDYLQASRQFRSFIQLYPNDALTPNAWYWLGESYYVTTNYPVALDSFEQLLKQFPQSEKAPDALLKVGYSQIELKQVGAAKTTLKTVTTKYPGSNAASLAQERLQRLQLQSTN